jgi:hypothetical protein
LQRVRPIDRMRRRKTEQMSFDRQLNEKPTRSDGRGEVVPASRGGITGHGIKSGVSAVPTGSMVVDGPMPTAGRNEVRGMTRADTAEKLSARVFV